MTMGFIMPLYFLPPSTPSLSNLFLTSFLLQYPSQLLTNAIKPIHTSSYPPYYSTQQRHQPTPPHQKCPSPYRPQRGSPSLAVSLASFSFPASSTPSSAASSAADSTATSKPTVEGWNQHPGSLLLLLLLLLHPWWCRLRNLILIQGCRKYCRTRAGALASESAATMSKPPPPQRRTQHSRT